MADPRLKEIAKLAADATESSPLLSVVVVVHGRTMFGSVIGARSYFEDVAASIKSEAMSAVLAKLPQQDDSGERLYLCKATIVDGRHWHEVGYTTVELSSVDAWTLGKLVWGSED